MYKCNNIRNIWNQNVFVIVYALNMVHTSNVCARVCVFMCLCKYLFAFYIISSFRCFPFCLPYKIRYDISIRHEFIFRSDQVKLFPSCFLLTCLPVCVLRSMNLRSDLDLHSIGSNWIDILFEEVWPSPCVYMLRAGCNEIVISLGPRLVDFPLCGLWRYSVIPTNMKWTSNEFWWKPKMIYLRLRRGRKPLHFLYFHRLPCVFRDIRAISRVFLLLFDYLKYIFEQFPGGMISISIH